MTPRSPKHRKSVGIILTYNCAAYLSDLVSRIPTYAVDRLIVIDDGSSDKTEKIAKNLGLPFYSHSHSGYGGNLVYGLKKALSLEAQYVVEIHGDGQYDPSDIPKAVGVAKKGHDIVFGTRFAHGMHPLRDGMPIFIFLANRVLTILPRLMVRMPLSEFHTGFHIYSKRFIRSLPLAAFSNNHLCSFEIIVATKFHRLSYAEFPIRCDYTNPHSSMGLGEGIVFAIQMFAVIMQYWLARFGVYTHPIFLKQPEELARR